MGDKVRAGSLILTLATEGAVSAPLGSASPATTSALAPGVAANLVSASSSLPDVMFDIAYAGPSVRKQARERGINLKLVKGSGPRGRILPDDLDAHTKGAASAASAPGNDGAGFSLLPWPKIDFSKFGRNRSQASIAHQENLRREPSP